jgi:hypothetical protein
MGLCRTKDEMKTLALHSPFPGPLPRLRLGAALLMLGAALVGAAILHDVRAARPACPTNTLCALTRTRFTFTRPGWTDPAAVPLLALGAAGAAGVLVRRRGGDR